MSRSGYSDDLDDAWQHIMWRGAVASAFRGKRGQLFLMEMLAALDAMPIKRLIAHELVDVERVSLSNWGLHEIESVCAIGAVGKRRNVDMTKLDPEDYSSVARTFGIAKAMTQEIVYMNDEGDYAETPEMRYARVRAWVINNIEGHQ